MNEVHLQDQIGKRIRSIEVHGKNETIGIVLEDGVVIEAKLYKVSQDKGWVTIIERQQKEVNP